VFLEQDVAATRERADRNDVADVDVLELTVHGGRDLTRGGGLHARREARAGPRRQIHHVPGEQQRATIMGSVRLAHGSAHHAATPMLIAWGYLQKASSSIAQAAPSRFAGLAPICSEVVVRCGSTERADQGALIWTSIGALHSRP
jgi:hypothetical protein